MGNSLLLFGLSLLLCLQPIKTQRATEENSNEILNRQYYDYNGVTLYWKETTDKIKEKLNTHISPLKNVFGPIKSVNIQSDNRKYGPNNNKNSTNRQHLCNLAVNLEIPLTYIRNEVGHKLYTIYTEKHQNLYRLIQCSSDQTQSRCNKNIERLPLGETSECFQKTSSAQILVYNMDLNKMVTFTLTYPSACVCDIVS